MFASLDWLPAAGDDFRAAWRSLQSEAEAPDGPSDGLFERAVAFATAAYDEVQLSRLSRLSRSLRSRPAPPPGFLSATIGLVGDGTLSLIGDPIVGTGLRHGLLLDVVTGDYGGALQEAEDPHSVIRDANVDMLLVAPDARLLGLDTAAPDVATAQARVEQAFDTLRRIAEGFRPSVKGAVMIQTLAPPLEGLFGSLDQTLAGSPLRMVQALNDRIADWAAAGDVVLVDVARLACAVGLAAWHDPGHWHASKLAFAPAMLPLHAELVARTVAAIKGRSRKCLVLDLDNTLWGGVIGDDGVAGIVLGQGSGTGEAFLAVQRLALELRARGVLLAVCSKNEEAAARLPFREHPDMLLREDHIAAFNANWTDKAANLRAIAEALNIGVDALVFLDDNPAERMQVRQALPLVGVPELPDDVALYPRTLAAAGYFEAVAFSDEDRARADYYQGNARRAEALTASGDMESYLDALEMTCTIGLVDAVSRPRVAQLINKSNQFNLTTRRYSEAEVQAAETDPLRHVIQVRLADRFGDNGIISVIVADRADGAWSVDTWLMSCRVLGRRVEDAVLAHLVAAARADGASRLIGRYIRSAKNAMVAAHYAKLGFIQQDAAPGEDGAETTTLWALDLADHVGRRLPMKILDTALPMAVAAE